MVSIICRVFVILQVSSCLRNSCANKCAAPQDETPSWGSIDAGGGVTIQFSPNQVEVGGVGGSFNFDMKTLQSKNNNGERSAGGEEGSAPMSDLQTRLQAHVQQEISKMMAENKFLPQNFKVNLPPDLVGSLEGTQEIDVNVQSLADSGVQRKKNYQLPESGLNEAIVRVGGQTRHSSREGSPNDENMKRKNIDVPGSVSSDLNDWDYENEKKEIEARNRSKPEGFLTIDHVEVLKKIGLSSYPTVCPPEWENSMMVPLLRDMNVILPASFIRYDCNIVLGEMRQHQKVAIFSETAVLEELFFSLLGLSEDEILNEELWKNHPLVQDDNWFSNQPICTWGGVTCGYTTIGVGVGTIDNTPNHMQQTPDGECKRSRSKSRHQNRCDGTQQFDEWVCEPCPPADSVTKLDLTTLGLPGTLPDNLYMLTHLHRLNVMGNSLRGGIPDTYEIFLNLEFLDVSKNSMSGPLPDRLPASLNELWLEENRFTGTIPTSFGSLTSLSFVDVSSNSLEGSIPKFLGNMTWLSSLYLSRNQFTGKIPEFLPTVNLRLLDFSHNTLEGTIPSSIPQLLYSLEELDLSSNHLTGSVPAFPHNHGQLWFNLTGNEFTGSLLASTCEGPYTSIFGCADTVMCRPGTFSPTGAASHFGPCVLCDEDDPFLGQTTCSSREYLVGDIDLDGVLSEREILHLLFTYTHGFEWGSKYNTEWMDLQISACHLPGIACEKNQVININLTDAALCSGYRKHINPCLGLPSEIGLLSQLKSLDMSGTVAKLKGSIPSEIGSLANLEYLNLEHSSLKGSIPSEFARLESLKTLNLNNCGLSGTLPPLSSFKTRLQTLNLALNYLNGSIPQSYGHLYNLEELILSRNQLTGTIINFSKMKKLDNIELYGNSLVGSIPKSIGGCSGLKRIDLFSNALTGTIPSEFGNIPSLQIIHFKANSLSGTLPPTLLNDLPNFVWLDVSGNKITGTIPPSYGQSQSLKDLRLGGNLIYGPIADELCTNKKLNDSPEGDKYDCDHILCPLGAISDAGYATKDFGCTPCPEGQSTMHLGSDSCRVFTDEDILKMFYELLGGDETWDQTFQADWTSDKPVCEWHGVTCGGGEVTGLSFPNSGLKL